MNAALGTTPSKERLAIVSLVGTIGTVMLLGTIGSGTVMLLGTIGSGTVMLLGPIGSGTVMLLGTSRFSRGTAETTEIARAAAKTVLN